jgi:nucleotide-binding universal stress UspA family protein
MRKLLVPVDGSRCSLRALKYAAAQARYGPVTLHLLNTKPPRDDYGMVGAHVTERQHRKAAMARASEVLKRAIAAIGPARVPHVTHAVIGDTAAAIVNAARRLKCESIVMGTHGRGALGILLLGSVAIKVVHLARVPVTLVK